MCYNFNSTRMRILQRFKKIQQKLLISIISLAWFFLAVLYSIRWCLWTWLAWLVGLRWYETFLFLFWKMHQNEQRTCKIKRTKMNLSGLWLRPLTQQWMAPSIDDVKLFLAKKLEIAGWVRLVVLMTAYSRSSTAQSVSLSPSLRMLYLLEAIILYSHSHPRPVLKVPQSVKILNRPLKSWYAYTRDSE